MAEHKTGIKGAGSVNKGKRHQKSVRITPPEAQASTSDPTQPDDHAHDLYIEHQKQAWDDLQSGSDEFDKSILTYSSAGLGISLIFLKDIVPFNHAVGLILLYSSWIAFGAAILVTVFSFQLSGMSQEKHLEHLRKYYLERRPEYLNAHNSAGLWVERLKWISGACFVLAVTGTIVFAIWNLTEARRMSENKNDNGRINFQDGRQPLSMTPLEKGRKPTAMTPLLSTALPQQPQPASNKVPPPQTPIQPKTDK